jgi:hypothetical protein
MSEILEKGDYRAKASEAVLGKSAKKGTPQIAVKFDLLDFPGRTITWFGYLSDAAFDITMRGLDALGFTGNDLSDLSAITAEGAPEVVLVVDHEQYEGKWSAKVKFINAAGGLSLQGALPPDEARSFAARLKGKVAAYRQSAVALAKPVASARPGPSAARPAARPVSRAAPAPADEVPLDVLDAQADSNTNTTDDIDF